MDTIFIPYEKALALLAANTFAFETVSKPISECQGLILAEDLEADRDFPPYDRITMDGIALQFGSFKKGIRSYPIEATAPAGSPRTTLTDASNCIEVMTGAMLPLNTDTVVRYEDVDIVDGIASLLPDVVIKEQQNIHFKGMDIPKNDIIVNKGVRISSAEINIAASVGKAELRVKKMPKVVVISTGDELVDIIETPKPHQIRRSNVYGIQNTLNQWGISADLYHLPDAVEEMTQTVKQLLNDYDVLVFTGGVSKGKFDYVPEVLKNLGVERHFHKIKQRPGKPFWFGSWNNSTSVFALPGNPVSSFVCLYVYIRYWLLKSLGLEPQTKYVKLLEDVHFKPDLTYFPAAKLHFLKIGELGAQPLYGNGSGDFANLVQTDGFLVLPQGETTYKKGTSYPFIAYRDFM